MSDRQRWSVVVLYAAGMAWVEAAVVYYLRTMINRIEPYQAYPLPIAGGIARVELAREAATLLMLLTVGVLAGRTWRARLGYAAVAFGVWDILYYAFLRVMCRWPDSLLDWDILFLIPLPWWGPVLAPVCISLLMIVWGTLASQALEGEPVPNETWPSWGLAALGCGLALYVFMADALRVAGQGEDALRRMLPKRFNWPMFLAALLLMAAPLLEIGWRVRSRLLPLPVKTQRD